MSDHEEKAREIAAKFSHAAYTDRLAEAIVSALSSAVEAERTAWRSWLKDLGPLLRRASDEGVLDCLIDGNVWPEPSCVVTDADMQKAMEIACSIREDR